MADTKITALTALTAADPANDVIPIVDVSDTSMAASGTTKKISVNNILGASGTATLASATITGDLTARNWFLTGGSLPGVGNGNPFAYRIGGGSLGIGAATETGTTAHIAFYCGQGGIEQYRIAPLGVNTWSDGAGGTRMTLNSTGLGVKGTVGTASGDAVIAFGTRGVIVGNAASAIASASYIDVAVVTGGEGYQGFLSVANTVDASANLRTQTTYSVFGRGTSSTITQIATANGSSGGASFTVTTPSNGVIRITNTSGLAATISAQFFGGTSL